MGGSRGLSGRGRCLFSFWGGGFTFLENFQERELHQRHGPAQASKFACLCWTVLSVEGPSEENRYDGFVTQSLVVPLRAAPGSFPSKFPPHTPAPGCARVL